VAFSDMRLKDFRTNSGSRQFAELRAVSGPRTLRDHLLTLEGVAITEFLPAWSSEDSWIDFTFRGYSFSVNGHFGDWWFFVSDPNCPDTILWSVFDHCRKILPVTDWMGNGPANTDEARARNEAEGSNKTGR
jgi:hypothetical protein